MSFGVVRVAVGQDFRADVAAKVPARGRDTVQLVGSAPAHPRGVVNLPFSNVGQTAYQDD